MATIDIGKIKPVFKGTYDNSVSYVLDDIVYYNGSSYVAKTSTTGNLPTDTTKWNVLASGSGGIWDSSLSIGSTGQVVKVSSGGALEFGTISTDAVKVYSGTNLSGNNIDFDNVFTDTYQFYKVHISEAYNSTNAGNYLAIRMINDSGSITSSNNYNYSRVYGYRNQSNSSGSSAPGNTDDDKGTIAWNGQNGTGSHSEIAFHNTRLSNKYTNFVSSGHWYDGAVTWSSGIGGNHLKVNEAHRGFRLFGDGGGTLNIVNIQIYGFKN